MTHPHLYILDGKTPIPVTDLLQWGKWMESAARTGAKRVAKTDIGEVHISTVFLGIDHRFGFDEGAPVLFETMIFGGRYDQYQDRYITWFDAERGHAEAVQLVEKEAIANNDLKLNTAPLTESELCKN